MNMLTRRNFLIGTATTALAAGMARRAAANDRIAVALIGCRNRGHQVAHTCLRTGRFDLITVCDCDSAMADRGLEELKPVLPTRPKVERDFRRVLDDPNVDAVINATPDHWHAMITALALEAGKHVYLEKPATHHFSEGEFLIKAQEAHPKSIILVGTQQRSAPHFADAKAFIQSGGLGKVGFCRAWITSNRDVLAVKPDAAPPETLDYDLWLGPAPNRPYNENRVHYNWRFFRDYGTGEMGNWGAHWIDTVLWFMDLGFPNAVSGHGGQFITKDVKEWPDTQTVLYEYPELTLLWEQRIWTKSPINGKRNGAEFCGEKGTLIIDRGGYTVFPKDGEPKVYGDGGHDMEENHSAHFAECIAGSASPVADIAAGHQSAALCHMGNIAVTLNRRLEFDRATRQFTDAAANEQLTRPYREPWSLRL